MGDAKMCPNIRGPDIRLQLIPPLKSNASVVANSRNVNTAAA